MEVTLSHAEVDQRADELARLIFRRDVVEAEQDAAMKELKKSNEKTLAKFESEIRRLAGAVANHRETRTEANLELPLEGELPVGEDPSEQVADEALTMSIETGDPEPAPDAPPAAEEEPAAQ